MEITLGSQSSEPNTICTGTYIRNDCVICYEYLTWFVDLDLYANSGQTPKAANPMEKISL